MAPRRYRRKGAARRAPAKGRRFRYKRTTGAAKVGKTFASKVKKVIHGIAESKSWERLEANKALNGAVSGVVSVDPTCINCLPWISQGTGQSGRIGNRIRLVKNKFTGILTMIPPGSGYTYFSPIYLKMWVFSPKSFTNFVGDMGNSNWKQFFQVNNADSGFYGNCLDMLQNVNTELYTVHTTRTFVFTNQLGGYNAVSGNVLQSPSGTCTHRFTLNLSKYVKDLRYDDDSSSRPTNKNLLIAFQTINADGTTNGTVTNNNSIELHYVQECEYKDL